MCMHCAKLAAEVSGDFLVSLSLFDKSNDLKFTAARRSLVCFIWRWLQYTTSRGVLLLVCLRSCNYLIDRSGFSSSPMHLPLKLIKWKAGSSDILLIQEEVTWWYRNPHSFTESISGPKKVQCP